MESQAVVFTGPNTVKFQPIISPDPGPDDVVVDVHHSWISNGTEGSFLRGERLSGDVAWKPGDPAPFPRVAGYQKVGKVREVGSAVSRFKPGDWVFASMSRVTGTIENQFAGHVSPAVCSQGAVMLLPAGLDPVAYAGLVLTQVGFNCGSRSPVTPGSIAVVIGDGLVGQWAGQTLVQRGARVVMVGRHPDRLARFSRHGDTVLAREDLGVAGVRAAVKAPVHILVETVGSADTLRAYLPLMARGGHIVIAGFFRPSGSINLQSALESFRNYEISFDLVSGATAARLEETLTWVAAGRLDTLGCITHRFPVERAAEAWERINAKREAVLGVVLDWPAARNPT